MDASGDAIVVGSFYQSVSLGGTTVTSDFNNMSGFAWKLNYSSGATDWAVQVDTTGGGSSSQAGYSGMSGVAVDGGGNIYVSGELGSGSWPGDFYFGSTEIDSALDGSAFSGVVWKLNASGSTDWAVASTSGDTSSLVGLAINSYGKAFTAGMFAGSLVLDGVTLTPAGGFAWPLADVS